MKYLRKIGIGIAVLGAAGFYVRGLVHEISDKAAHNVYVTQEIADKGYFLCRYVEDENQCAYYWGIEKVADGLRHTFYSASKPDEKVVTSYVTSNDRDNGYCFNLDDRDLPLQFYKMGIYRPGITESDVLSGQGTSSILKIMQTRYSSEALPTPGSQTCETLRVTARNGDQVTEVMTSLHAGGRTLVKEVTHRIAFLGPDDKVRLFSQ